MVRFAAAVCRWAAAAAVVAAAVPVSAATSVATAAYGQASSARAAAGQQGSHGGEGFRGGDPALQAVLDNAVRLGSPGALAQVRKYGRTYNLSSGVADLRTGQRPVPGMHFRIASVTKAFVATVIMQLAGEGRLRFGDTVDRWLPGVVEGNGNDGSKITLRMLLNHTSGLYNYADDEALNKRLEQNHFVTVTPRELVRTAMRHRPSFPPGSGWAYSDTNYILLGMVIGRVTGHGYATEITRRITGPLGLSQTYLPGTSPGVRWPRMHGYTDETPGKRLEDVTYFNPSFLGASGEMISTTGDLDRFDSALLSGRLLPRRLVDQMLTPTPGSFPGTSFRYGLGMVITRLPCGVTVYGNAGELDLGTRAWVTSTRDGRHVMSFDLNGPAADPSLELDASTAEFCPQPHA